MEVNVKKKAVKSMTIDDIQVKESFEWVECGVSRFFMKVMAVSGKAKTEWGNEINAVELSTGLLFHFDNHPVVPRPDLVVVNK